MVTGVTLFRPCVCKRDPTVRILDVWRETEEDSLAPKRLLQVLVLDNLRRGACLFEGVCDEDTRAVIRSHLRFNMRAIVISRTRLSTASQCYSLLTQRDAFGAMALMKGWNSLSLES